MSDLSPPISEENDAESGRSVATGALRRVFKSREKARNRNRLGSRLSSEEDSGSESDGQGHRVTPHTRNTSNHYTLNLPSASAHSDTPYILLGYAFSQIFCNVIHILFPVTSSSSSTCPWSSSFYTLCCNLY
jgi:hypothetical protein